MNAQADDQESVKPALFVPYPDKLDEEYMCAAQKEHFLKILRAWKHELMTEVDQTVENMQGDADAYADHVDRASREEVFTLELRTRDRERKLLKKIEKSIDTIDSDDYGYCDNCSAEIGIKRLEARPTATKCIDCKTFEEIREKQTGA
jgi:DnaK suppressor protein